MSILEIDNTSRRAFARPWRHAIVAAGLTMLTGCLVGPKYRPPPIQAPGAYKELAPADGVSTVAWKPARPSDTIIRDKWWRIFGDPQLDALEDQVDISNQNIAAAVANYAAARALVRQARSQFSPTVTVGASFNSERLSVIPGTGATSGKTYREYSFPIEASWEPDLWGRVRNTARAAAYAAQASSADLQSVRLAAHAQLAANYFALRGQDSLKQVLDSTLTSSRDTLDITRGLYRAGLTTNEAVSAAEAQFNATQALEKNTGILRAQYEHAIAIVLGKTPAEIAIPPTSQDPIVPFTPPGVPARLLERRPDIAAAERGVAAANAQIDVARAAFFPDITLSASGGFTSFTAADWFTWPSRVWAVGPTLAETIFDAGLRRATVQQYRSRYEQAVATYRQTSLIAFQQVEDNLAADRILRSELLDQDAAIAAAQRGFDESQVRYRAGLDPYINVIQAQMSLLSYQQTAVNLHCQQMIAAVQLIEALGGGWDATQLPDVKSVNQLKSR